MDEGGREGEGRNRRNKREDLCVLCLEMMKGYVRAGAIALRTPKQALTSTTSYNELIIMTDHIARYKQDNRINFSCFLYKL